MRVARRTEGFRRACARRSARALRARAFGGKAPGACVFWENKIRGGACMGKRPQILIGLGLGRGMVWTLWAGFGLAWTVT